MRLKRPSVHVARAIDRALSGEMVKTLRPAARGDGDGAPRHVKHAHKAKKPDALVLAFQQALLRNPAPGAFHPPPARCGVRAPSNPTPSTRRPVVSPRRRRRGGRESNAIDATPRRQLTARNAGARARRRGRPEPPPREDAHGAQEDQVLRQRPGHQGRLDQKTARHPQALNPEPPTSSTKAKNKN